jgi:hypothetical protein
MWGQDTLKFTFDKEVKDFYRLPLTSKADRIEILAKDFETGQDIHNWYATWDVLEWYNVTIPNL